MSPRTGDVSQARPHDDASASPPAAGARADGDANADACSNADVLEEAEHWVASPCTGLCILQLSGLCKGCGRTMDEITRWTCLDSSQRRAVLDAARIRLAAAH